MEKTRQTKQRTLLLDILRQADAPLTAGELYRRAVAECPSLAKSTVYRNLDAMAGRGELTRGFLENGESFFGLQETEHHHYMICRDCNKMQHLPSCPMQHLQQELSACDDFVAMDHVVQVYGYCRDCAKNHKK